MPLPHAGAEGARSRRARRAAVLRAVGFGLAVVLGAVAVWLIVTSTSQKRIELGILAGLWGLLLGTFAAFGTRRTPAAGDPGGPQGQALTLRAHSELERADESAARLRFESRLELMLRQEIQTTFGREIAALREEVASLRNELLEKVGGQLRLERIETTRVIGSDIEALYREIDQLKRGPGARTVPALAVGTPDPAEPLAPARPRAVSPGQHETAMTQPIALVEDGPRGPSPTATGPIAAEPAGTDRRAAAAPSASPAPAAPAAPSVPSVPPVPPAPPAPSASPASPAPAVPSVPPAPPARPGARPAASDATPPAPAAPHAPSPSPHPQPQPPEPAPAESTAAAGPGLPPRPLPGDEVRPAARASLLLPPPGADGDPFANLPRLSPFADDGPDPGRAAEPVRPAPARETPAGHRPGLHHPPAGRHGLPESDQPHAGGRRRRAPDAEDNVLARILARESAER